MFPQQQRLYKHMFFGFLFLISSDFLYNIYFFSPIKIIDPFLYLTQQRLNFMRLYTYIYIYIYIYKTMFNVMILVCEITNKLNGYGSLQVSHALLSPGSLFFSRS